MDALERKYGTIKRWCDATDMSRTGTYNELGRGNLKSIKVGNRTLIDFEAGLNWLQSMPPAQIRAPKSSD